MSFPRYPRYKDSGVECLGPVPEHWDVTAMKRFNETVTDGAHISPETDVGVYHFVSTKDVTDDSIDFESCLRTSPQTYEYMVKTGCRPQVGDVLFSKDGTIGRTVVVRQNREFVVASSLIIIRPDRRLLNADCINYLCQSKFVTGQVESFVKGAGLPRLSIQNLLKVAGCFPPTTEQNAIAAFLDRETRKIDELVAEQRRLVELLREKRQAVISHVVTRGLNHTTPLKPSGIEWLGDVPKHWEVCLLKRAFRSVDYGISDSLDSEGAVAILRMGNIENGKVVTDDLKYTDAVDPALLLVRGDLLYNRTNSLDLIGKVGMFLGGNESPVSFASYLVRLRTVNESLPEYFAYLLNTDGILGLARANAFVAIGQCNLNPTRYGQIGVAIPPKEEQVAIVEYLDAETARLDTLTAEAQRAIGLLQERRTALISAAVTGQIKVV